MFDINAATGHWPFRRVPNESLSGLHRRLEEHGIESAAVVNTHALFYKNAHDANLELADEISNVGGFFVGIATLNPTYAAWERDLVVCKEDLRMRGIRITPQYHDYEIVDDAAIAIVSAAADIGLPVFVPSRVVDIRQRHWLDADRQISVDDVVRLCESVPEAWIVVTESVPSTEHLVDGDNSPKCPNLYFELSRIPSSYGQAVSTLIAAIGAERVLFGTGAPFKEITPAVLKLQAIDCSESDRQMIASVNARRLLGLATDP